LLIDSKAAAGSASFQLDSHKALIGSAGHMSAASAAAAPDVYCSCTSVSCRRLLSCCKFAVGRLSHYAAEDPLTTS
jgi:hypothetical protein